MNIELNLLKLQLFQTLAQINKYKMNNLKDEMTPHPLIMLYNLRMKLQDELDAEMEEIKDLCLSNIKKSKIYRRILFESVKNHTESRIKTVKYLYIYYCNYFKIDLGADYQFVKEVDLDLYDSGKISEKMKYYDLRSNISYLNNIMNKTIGYHRGKSSKYYLSDKLILCLSDFLFSYLRITGPLYESQIKVTDDEIKNCTEFYFEYDKLYNQYIKGLKYKYQIRTSSSR